MMHYWNMKRVLELNGYEIEVELTDTCLKIYDSYKIEGNDLKRQFINLIVTIWPHILKTRSVNSLINEWKVHNAFFNRGWEIERTADTDLELVQTWYHKILYWLLSKVLREKC